GITIHFHQAFDAALIHLHVRVGRQRHEAVGQACFWVDRRRQLPLTPAVIVLADSEAEGFEWLRTLEKIVAALARKKSRQYGVVRLPDQNKLVALFLENHSAALTRSAYSAKARGGFPCRSLDTTYSSNPYYAL